MSEWLSPLVEMGVLTPGLVELLGIGGPVVAILLVFSMVAVTLIVGKSLQLLLATWQSKTKVSNSLSLFPRAFALTLKTVKDFDRRGDDGQALVAGRGQHHG